MRIFTLLTIVTMSIKVYGQTFIDDIKVGQKMPAQINKGGYTEEESEKCTCRIFSINYNVQSWETGGGGAVLGQVIAIHYNENDTVVGIIKMISRKDKTDALKVYIARLSEYLRTISKFPDRKFLVARDYKPADHSVDGIYYFGYLFNNDKYRKVTGVVENTIIEETYIPKSSYKPALID